MPRTKEPRDKRFEATARFYEHTCQPATREELWWRHGCWWNLRQRVRESLVRTAANVFQLDRFDNCGGDCGVEYSASLNKHRLRACYCKNRHCQPCAKAKANLIARNLRNELANKPKHQHRFITLTLRHTTTPLADQIKKLYRSFKKLRNRPLWKKSQDGGAFMLEVKHTKTGWHPHLHIISAGRFINKFELSREWREVTGDSEIVDVRSIDREKDVVHYVCRYVAKGSAVEIWQTPELADEFVISTRHVRACQTFGTWRGFRLLACPKSATDWKPIASLNKVWNAARNDEAWAVAILQSLLPDHQTLELE